MQQIFRAAFSTALDATGRVFSLTGTALAAAARLLRSDSDNGAAAEGFRPQVVPPPATPTRESTPASATTTADVMDQLDDTEVAARRGRVVEVPDTPLLDEQPHVRRPETHIEELASKPAAQVIKAVEGLSTDELRLLLEYETAHRNRRTVLPAIE